jgi:hypothetical protein
VRAERVGCQDLGDAVGPGCKCDDEGLQSLVVDVAEDGVGRIRDRDRPAAFDEGGAEVGSGCAGAVVRIEIEPGGIIDRGHAHGSEGGLALFGTVVDNQRYAALARGRVLGLVVVRDRTQNLLVGGDRVDIGEHEHPGALDVCAADQCASRGSGEQLGLPILHVGNRHYK